MNLTTQLPPWNYWLLSEYKQFWNLSAEPIDNGSSGNSLFEQPNRSESLLPPEAEKDNNEDYKPNDPTGQEKLVKI